MRQLTVDKLAELSLNGMRKALEGQEAEPRSRDLSFEDRLLMLLDAEELFRKQRSLEYRLKAAGLRQNARMEELDYKAARSFDRALLDSLSSCRWLKEKRNLLLTGPTGIGKTFLACALAGKACQMSHSARYFRLPRLLSELSVARGQGTSRTKLAAIARIDLLVLDDWGLTPLTDVERRDLLEIFDDRYDRRSTLVCAQLPVENWHEAIGPSPTPSSTDSSTTHTESSSKGNPSEKQRGFPKAAAVSSTRQRTPKTKLQQTNRFVRFRLE
jgi:DNA replication protein DnaC